MDSSFENRSFEVEKSYRFDLFGVFQQSGFFGRLEVLRYSGSQDA